MYTYRAHVTNVHDGDTITVDIDLGFFAHLKGVKIRFFGINAPELKGDTLKQGRASRDAVKAKIMDKDIVIQTLKDKQEKYGRWLGIISIDDLNLNDWLVQNKYAVPFMVEDD